MNTFTENFLTNKAGLRVIGDVHGNAFNFVRLIEDAREKNLAILSLGDITDRGKDSPGAIRALLEMLSRGDGTLVPGNHCWKAARLFTGKQAKINNGLQDTIEQLDSEEDGEELKRKFADAVLSANVFHRANNYIFAHGAITYYMTHGEPFSLKDKDACKRNAYSMNIALYGQSDGILPNGYPHRRYEWMHELPENIIGMIGHDYLNDDIISMKGNQGATIYFLDTGSSKGGSLSYMDIPIEKLIE